VARFFFFAGAPPKNAKLSKLFARRVVYTVGMRNWTNNGRFVAVALLLLVGFESICPAQIGCAGRSKHHGAVGPGDAMEQQGQSGQPGGAVESESATRC
jgi:hypothetical protein